MAKDGTNRGGRRVNSGEKPQALVDKIATGKKAKIMEFAPLDNTSIGIPDLDVDESLSGEDIPKPSSYLSAKQRDGSDLDADMIFLETWKWLKERRCDKLVNPRVVEAYAQSFARYIQCENAVSTFGYLGKHPTTGAAICSPFVQMSQSFQKQANLLWYEIFEVVKQNSMTAYEGNPQVDVMEKLLSKQGEKK